MEALRYLPMLNSEGWVITNTTPFINIPNYPDIEKVLAEIKKYPNNITIDADKIAKNLKSPKSANIVLLGAASQFLALDYEKLENAINDAKKQTTTELKKDFETEKKLLIQRYESGIKLLFGRKGEDVVNANLNALKAGREFASKIN